MENSTAGEVPRCPLFHGSVGTAPFPGYTHGRHPEICRYGCRPEQEVEGSETTTDKLMREAFEFQDLFHAEFKSSKSTKAERRLEIERQVRLTGTYTHTFEELQHGARVGWRNAPKCANRKVWAELQLLDRRDVHTNEGMFEACLEHFKMAQKKKVTDSFITIFPAAKPGERKGPRVWNDQLIRYAGYRNDDMSIKGDPANLGFTEMIQNKFDWKPPEKRSMFDILPLVLQANPSEPPQMFEIPDTFILQVGIWHPEHPWLGKMGLKWYGVPAVSNFELEVGGLLYTGIPFNGWYADTEVVRDFADEERYDLLPEIAGNMGLDTTRESSLWKDQAILVLNKAVVHSFQHEGVGMVDHHTLINGFYQWYYKEKRERGYCPGNWKWVIPPLAASTSPAYMKLNKMTEYTLKPVYKPAPGWRQYEKAVFGGLDKTKVLHKANVLNLVTEATARFLHRGLKDRVFIFIMYATVSGTTRRYANKLAGILKEGARVEVQDTEEFDPHKSDTVNEKLEKCDVFLFLTSTYGNGVPPHQAHEFETFLAGKNCPALEGKPYAVLGFGCSRYVHFCGGAARFNQLIAGCGAVPFAEVGECDEMGGTKRVFYEWTHNMVERLEELTQRNEYTRIKESLSDIVSEKSLLEHAIPTIQNLSKEDVVAMTLEQILPQARVPQRDAKTSAEFWQVGTVLEVKELLKEASDDEFGSSTCLVRVDISNCGNPPYTPGDHVSIMPENRFYDDELKSFASNLGVDDPDAVFAVRLSDHDLEEGEELAPIIAQVKDKPTTLRMILRWTAGAREKVDAQSCMCLAHYATDAQDVELLTNLSQKKGKIQSVRWYELFDRCPSLSKKIELGLILTLMPLNIPRYYSISSSKRKVGEEVHVTVGKVVYTTPDEVKRLGVASSHMCSIEPGSVMQFQLHPSAFSLPMDNRAPIIMVAAGTGIAPLRGFWQHREMLIEAGVNLGTCVLVFGCRTSTTDFLFEQEINQAVEKGAITRTLLAFSKEGIREYVQHKILGEPELFKELLDHPMCCVYVCGASKMAAGVAEALRSVGGDESFNKIVNDARYYEDVF
ncbi:hypothetical protein BSKO_13846 [Bryopsis sp. KO-2023]|nr:hypothetical protein BSKO_13846 [Bryopsis sp. KO-2023]